MPFVCRHFLLTQCIEMSDISEQIKRARLKWKFRGDSHPDFADIPESGQESVWDYPRPPAIDPNKRNVIVSFDQIVVAESINTIRILETASPPVFYIPQDDIDINLLGEKSGSSICEWKGAAVYWDVIVNSERIFNAGWSYPRPFPGYEQIANYIAFYPSKLDCFVDGEKVRPQPGEFYGGWVTSDIAGPFKGERGSEWW